MKAYRLKGTFYMRPDEQPFKLEVAAESEEEAREHTYSVLGSKHRAKRSQIHIYRVTELEPSDVTDPAIADIIDADSEEEE